MSVGWCPALSTMRCFYHIAVMLACLLPAGAVAAPEPNAWDRVNWGMTSEQIARAYGDRALILTEPIVFGDSYVDVALLDVPFAGYPFRVYFQMDPKSHRLAHVMLERRRSYASPNAWNAVVARLHEEFGTESLACNRPGKRGKPTDIAGIWQLPDETIKATFLDFAAPVMRYAPDSYLIPNSLLEVQPFYKNLYPARRILIRYSPKEPTPATCG
jgi:hypothetical protein